MNYDFTDTDCNCVENEINGNRKDKFLHLCYFPSTFHSFQFMIVKVNSCEGEILLETDPMVFVGEFAAAAKHQRVSIRAPPACISSPTCWRRHCKRTPKPYYRTPKPQFNRTQGWDWAGHQLIRAREKDSTLSHFPAHIPGSLFSLRFSKLMVSYFLLRSDIQFKNGGDYKDSGVRFVVALSLSCC